MAYDVQVKEINEDFEEEISVQVGNIRLLCFVTNWRSNIKASEIYAADIGVTILDDLEMCEQTEYFTGFEQIDSSFAHFIYGKFDFDSGTIDAGIIIKFDQNEVDLFDYSHLDGKYVCAKVDRVTLAFV